MKLIKKYLSDGEQLLKTALLFCIVFMLLPIITDRSDFVINVDYLLMFIAVLHVCLLSRIVLGSSEQKIVKLGLVLAGIGILNSCLIMLGYMSVDNADIVIYELITIIVCLWGISLINFLRS